MSEDEENRPTGDSVSNDLPDDTSEYVYMTSTASSGLRDWKWTFIAAGIGLIVVLIAVLAVPWWQNRGPTDFERKEEAQWNMASAAWKLDRCGFEWSRPQAVDFYAAKCTPETFAELTTEALESLWPSLESDDRVRNCEAFNENPREVFERFHTVLDFPAFRDFFEGEC